MGVPRPEGQPALGMAHHFLDQKANDGHIDLVLDYANPVPAILSLKPSSTESPTTNLT